MKEFQKRYRMELALCASCMSLIYSPLAYSAIENELLVAELGTEDSAQKKDSYTINFNNVSIIELIRFTSKISGLNFVFEETDLQFSVTLVSEEAVTSKSMLAALSQVLRMHNLSLLEQDGNVLITNSKKINQIPTIVSADLPASHAGNAALITRVFRIKNANVNSIANILRPMISDKALIEVSAETRQLIVTDITTNVDQIAALLTSLDAPHTSLDVDAYKVKNIPPVELILLAQQILTPFTEGNPLVFVPQMNTNSIYVVSTPYLIDRALSLMEDLDVAPSVEVTGQGGGPATDKSSFFIYHPLHRSGEALEQELLNLATSLKEAGLADPAFLSTLNSMKWTPSTNSLVFTGDPQSIQKLQVMLQSMDVSTSTAPGAKGFFLYKLQHAPCERVLSELKQLSNKFSASDVQNKDLMTAINGVECVPSSNSLLISGTMDAIEQVKILIGEFDTAGGPQALPANTAFFVYKPKFLSGPEIEASLTSLVNDLTDAGLNDPALLQTIGSMHYVKLTESLIFTGDQSSLDKIQALLMQIDTSSHTSATEELDNSTFLLYKIQFVNEKQLIDSLQTFAEQLNPSDPPNKQVVTSLKQVKWIKESNALLFTGSKSTLEKISDLLKKFDTPALGSHTPVSRSASNFVIYNPRYLSGPDLISILQEFITNLQQSGVVDPNLYDAVKNLKWIDKTSTLLISGDPQAIAQVQQLLVRFDIPGKDVATPTIESIDNTSFLVYKLQYHPGNDIQTALKQVAVSLDKNKGTPPELVQAIDSLQWIQVTNSILCTGNQDILVRLKDLIQNLDTPLRQVFIEVLIIQTSLTNQQNFGLMWGGQIKYLNKTVLQTGNFPNANPPSTVPTTANPPFYNNLQTINGSTFPSNTSIPFSTGFDLGVIGDIIMHKGKSFLSLGSLLNAIQLDKDTTIVLNPKIITQDNRQSSIFVGQNVPYTGSIVTTVGQSSQQSTGNIEYRDVGVSLTITPILGDDNVITMNIVQDISQLVNGGDVNTSGTSLTGIQTTHAHMETRVHVPDNHFVALTGMISDNKTHYKTGIPCLGGLPVVGALFSETDRTDLKDNIIIFIRPQIVNTAQDYKAITEHQEWLYKDSARLPSLKEEFDEGIDLVKLPENE